MRKRFFGRYLLAHGLLTAPQLLAAVEYQDKYNSRLGDLAVALGLVTPFEAQQINALQVREDLRFGEAAVRLHLLTDVQVRDVLATQRDSHVLLGQAIETLGYMARPAIDGALTAFTAMTQDEPDGVVLPDEVVDKERALALFDLGQKLLLRAWNLPSKPDRGRIETLRLVLSDRNARVEIEGASTMTVLVGVPLDAARKAAESSTDQEPSDDAAQDSAVQELAKVLGENFCSVLAERGEHVHVSRVVIQGPRSTLPPAVRVLVVPYLTHLGQVLIALGL